MDMGLAGKVAVVGGASSGLGLAIATALAAEGTHTVMVGRRADELARQAASIGGYAFTADLTSADQRRRLVDSTAERYGGIDIVVWNSGGPRAMTAADIDTSHAIEAFDSLFVPLIDLVQLTLPHLKNSDAGRILAVTTAGVKEPNDVALSNAIRPGITGYLKTLSNELARYGITVNSLAPGRIETDRLRSLFPQRIPAELVGEIPLGHLGQPSAIGDAACFLASARAGYITGVTLTVDGGVARSIF